MSNAQQEYRARVDARREMDAAWLALRYRAACRAVADAEGWGGLKHHELTLHVCPTCYREALMFPSPSPALCPHPGTPHDREDPTPFTQADKEKST